MRYILGLILFLFSHNIFATQDCFILTHLSDGKILKAEGDCVTRHSPASTFKIPLSLMGFDSDIFQSTTSPTWPYHEKYNAWIATQQQALNPSTWMQYSAVWYSQELTIKLGDKKFKNYMDAFGYGNGDISGDPGKNNGLTHSWLGSSLEISPKEQIAFISKILKNQLPISQKAYTLTQEILFREQLSNGWNLYGKTGTVFKAGQHIGGWFVGWVNKGNDTLVFAQYITIPDDTIKEPQKEMEYGGPRAREMVKKQLLALII